jgi:dTDP-4-amino-4,6-dideoxygalactose transaminase
MIKYLDLKRINDAHGEEIRQAMMHVLDSGWYLKGEMTQLFEEHYADYIGSRHCISCGNGLDALTLILRAYMEMGVMQKGDEVIVPANTYIASILSITECGLTPILVEPSIDTFQIDDSLIEEAITPRTRAVMIVHLYGRCAFTEKIGSLCKKHQLKLIEDNAQAHGCRLPMDNGQETSSCQLSSDHSPLKRTGSLGDAAAHSFYPGKNLGALGDAGAVTTNDQELARTIASIGNYGSSRKYVFDYIGRNSRMDELQAAILDVKLKYLDKENQRRRDIARYYLTHIQNPEITLPTDSSSVYHIFPLLCAKRNELQQYLETNGVQTQIHYPIPPHKQKCYRKWNTYSFPITERIDDQELSIPCHQAMTKKEVELVADLLNHFSTESTLR